MVLPRAVIGCSILGAIAACGGPTDRPPNVLVVSVDTLRADHLGVYGYDHGTSPNIDALAAGGVVFEHALSSSSWTSPAFASVLTSFRPPTHGVGTYTARLDESFRTLPEHFREAGYDTCGVTSHTFFSSRSGMRQGFIHFDESIILADENPRTAITSEAVADRGVRWIELKAASTDDRPWLLWLHYFDPHDAYERHPRFVDRFPPGSEVDLYDGEIAYTDFHIGRVLDALEGHGFAENTIVALFSDHGEEFGDHGSKRHGHTLYEELVRIPFIVRAPGGRPGRVGQNVRIVDLLPTLLDLAGIQPPPENHGRSLVPLLGGTSMAEAPALLELRLDERRAFESIVDGHWKLIRSRTRSSSALFDLLEDPLELRNLAMERPGRAQELHEALDGMFAEALDRARDYPVDTPQGLTQGELDNLRRLGYVGDE